MASLAAERLQSPIHSTGLWGPPAALQPYILLRAVGTPHAVLPTALSPAGSWPGDREVCGAVFGADPSGWGGCTLGVPGICLNC